MPDTLDTNQALALYAQGAWIPLSALIVHALVRALKNPELPWPLSAIPPRVRPLVAVLLGILSGVLDRIVNGTPWKPALYGGLVAGALAIMGHEVFIQSLREGRDWLVQKRAVWQAPAPASAPPSPASPPASPPGSLPSPFPTTSADPSPAPAPSPAEQPVVTDVPPVLRPAPPSGET